MLCHSLPEAKRCAMHAVRARAAAAHGLQVLHSGSDSNLVKRVWMKAAAVSKTFSVVDDLESTRVRGSGMRDGERRSWL